VEKALSDLVLVTATTCVGLHPNVVELIQVSSADCKVLMFGFKISSRVGHIS